MDWPKFVFSFLNALKEWGPTSPDFWENSEAAGCLDSILRDLPAFVLTKDQKVVASEVAERRVTTLLGPPGSILLNAQARARLTCWRPCVRHSL